MREVEYSFVKYTCFSPRQTRTRFVSLCAQCATRHCCACMLARFDQHKVDQCTVSKRCPVVHVPVRVAATIEHNTIGLHIVRLTASRE